MFYTFSAAKLTLFFDIYKSFGKKMKEKTEFFGKRGLKQKKTESEGAEMLYLCR
jgi:hypothetical protein